MRDGDHDEAGKTAMVGVGPSGSPTEVVETRMNLGVEGWRGGNLQSKRSTETVANPQRESVSVVGATGWSGKRGQGPWLWYSADRSQGVGRGVGVALAGPSVCIM